MLEANHIPGVQLETVAVVRQPDRALHESDISPSTERRPEYQLKPSVLVVDDSADIAFMLLTILQHAGYETLMAISASEALAAAKREHFDLVISDIGMPGMDG